MSYESEIISAKSQISSLENLKYSLIQMDAIHAKLTTEFLSLLDTLWTLQAHFNGASVPKIVDADILAAASLIPSRFYPALGFTANPTQWTDLAPYKVPVLNGLIQDDIGSPFPLNIPGSEMDLLNLSTDLATFATNKAAILAKVSSLGALDVSYFPSLSGIPAANAAWIADIAAIDLLVPANPADEATYLLKRSARQSYIASQASIFTSLISDNGTLFFGWLTARVHRAFGTLFQQTILLRGKQVALDKITQADFKKSSLT